MGLHAESEELGGQVASGEEALLLRKNGNRLPFNHIFRTVPVLFELRPLGTLVTIEEALVLRPPRARLRPFRLQRGVAPLEDNVEPSEESLVLREVTPGM